MIESKSDYKSSIIGKQFKVLDKGFIRLVDVMGDDAAVVQAARTSYGKGTKSVSEDEGLIRYLLRHGHTTPFEMASLKFLVKVPMDTWRQWIRHRTASVNEYSTRYSVAIDDKQETNITEWRLQDTKNKQGGTDYLDAVKCSKLDLDEKLFHEMANKVYKDRLDAGVAREQARKDLPLSTYTIAYWKINLHNLLHFLSLRMDSHAQLEIRSYAEIIGHEIVANLFPMTWRAFQDYRLNAIKLSARDIKIIQELNGIEMKLQQSVYDRIKKENWFNWFNLKNDGSLKPNRERDEFEVKAKQLGMINT